MNEMYSMFVRHNILKKMDKYVKYHMVINNGTYTHICVHIYKYVWLLTLKSSFPVPGDTITLPYSHLPNLSHALVNARVHK
jgi:hypothetical protein